MNLLTVLVVGLTNFYGQSPFNWLSFCTLFSVSFAMWTFARKEVHIKKIEKVQTTTVTTKTIVTIKTSDAPDCFVEINPVKDHGSEVFYKAHGIPVRTITKFGKKRIYAIIPVNDQELSADGQAAKAKAITRDLDNHRRSSERAAARIAKNENTSLDSIMESGYDPTPNAIPFAIKYKETIIEEETTIEVTDIILETESEDVSEDETTAFSNEEMDIAEGPTTVPPNEELDDFDYAGTRNSKRGGYDPYSDTNSPDYIITKDILYVKLHTIINELYGEDLEIVTTIMSGTSERQLAKNLGISRTTLQGHREKLMNRLRDILGDFNIQ